MDNVNRLVIRAILKSALLFAAGFGVHGGVSVSTMAATTLSPEQQKVDALDVCDKKLAFWELNEIKNNPAKSPKNIFSQLNVYDGDGGKNLQKDADLLFEKLKPFLEEVKDKDEKGYAEYLKKFMETDGQRMRTVNAEEFARMQNSSDWCVVYQGCNKENSAKLRSGVPVIFAKESDAAKACCGSMYTTPYESRAFHFAVFDASNKGDCGDVVGFAVNKNAKVIDNDYQKAVVDEVVKRNPEYFKDYIYLCKSRIGKKCGMMAMAPNFDYFAKFVRERTGFDFFVDVENRSVDDRYEELDNNFLNLMGFEFKDGKPCRPLSDEKLSDEQRKARQDIIALIKEHPFSVGHSWKGFCDDEEFREKYFKIGDFLFDSIFYALRNDGLITKLMGYDLHVRNQSDFDVEREEKKAKEHNTLAFVPEGVCDIVKFENVVVCADELKPYEKLGLRSPYDLGNEQ